MNKTTKPFPVTEAQLAALAAAEKALGEIGLAFHVENPECSMDFEAVLSVKMETDWDAPYSPNRPKKANPEYRVGSWLDTRGEGKTFSLALQRFHERTDADRHRERAKSLRYEAERLEREANELEGKKAKRREDE
jgi:hypothetical protein